MRLSEKLGLTAVTLAILLVIIPREYALEDGKGKRALLLAGIYQLDLSPAILYETFVPIILGYKNRVWNKTDVTFNNWYNCVSETAPHRYSCPMTHHMNKAIVNLHVDFENVLPISEDEALDRVTDDSPQPETYDKEYYTNLIANKNFCDEINPHFSSMFIKTQRYEEYMKAIKNCNFGSGTQAIVETDIEDYTYPMRSPFMRMENNFYSNFYSRIQASSNLSLVGSALLTNTRTLLQGILLDVFYAEKNRWTNAMHDCSAHIIPHSLLTRKKLNESLNKILDQMPFKLDQEFSIDSKDLSRYYSVPIVDCAYSKSNFLVRILVPTVRNDKRQTLHLEEVDSLPFRFEDKVCRLKFPGDAENGYTMRYFKGLFAEKFYPTKCEPGKLCRVDQNSLYKYLKTDEMLRASECLSSLTRKKDVDQIFRSCDFSCKPLPDRTEVIKKSAAQFLITPGKQPMHAKVICGDRYFPLQNTDIGSIGVILPCNCQLNVEREIFYSTGSFCVRQEFVHPKIQYMIPYHFLPPSKRYIIKDEEETWIDLDTQIDREYIRQNFFYLDTDGRNPVASPGPNSFSPSRPLSQTIISSNSDGLAASVITLWITFGIVSCCLIVMQIYMILQMKKNIKEFSQRDSILYHVSDADVESDCKKTKGSNRQGYKELDDDF